ncbi:MULTISPECIES: cytochrome c [unclassified Arenibacter]|uniref:c-type cytochrome n=1 Tax=unclassified Arenibacter TaxID=2615047 RepID=UPI000E343C6E|nr:MULTISPECIES: cytochrome c [unclassified Arenibacter]MCM4164712.1 hypothetical protein [Arenibacter sp. A80]RFT55787.1 hypothetical protein D0S24_13995 [Arenibacter sp. P308M17]
MKRKFLIHICLLIFLGLCNHCSPKKEYQGLWNYEIFSSESKMQSGTLKLELKGETYTGTMISDKLAKCPIQDLQIKENTMSLNLTVNGKLFKIKGEFKADGFRGQSWGNSEKITLIASRSLNLPKTNKPLSVVYVLQDSDLKDFEKDIDHQGMIQTMDKDALKHGSLIYNSNCINCHGVPGIEGSIPNSLKFWSEPFKYGNDPYSMYRTITKGAGLMPPQMTLTPQEKYNVITYIRENFIKEQNKTAYFHVDSEYLRSLPKGSSKGPDSKPYQPWSDMDYGNFLINTYELADSETGIKRFHSPGPPPYPDENYLKNNFAYKGIAVRLDKGSGGISKGNAWMIFDHDLMRVAGGWTGEGFIDWEGILLNDKHETYPRTIGKLHFETPVEPAWADPETGSYTDIRFKARDGRRFGPLPKEWSHFKGVYKYGNKITISYSVGNTNILEQLGMVKMDGQIIFTRTMNIRPSEVPLQMRVVPDSVKVEIQGHGASLKNSGGFVVMDIPKEKSAKIKLYIAHSGSKGFTNLVKDLPGPESLYQYINGGEPQYKQEIISTIVKGKEDGPIAMDQLTPPFENPWNSRLKLSGIDFLEDTNIGVLCTTDGDIWTVTGLTDNKDNLRWKRIGSGLFQPLGIKVVNNNIYVICRDQIVKLNDLNGDGEIDFYENFNNDHQVTDHFHEFAMGLQTDQEGNFYYAKSGRHAREALVPQHGTLLKVSNDGSRTDIIATGFRAANGLCINPDGSFIVTDQQGFWNPMNRINWVEGKGRFYGNIWGYNPPKDTTRLGMEQPMVWIDMEFDRSPSELLWVSSKKWGPLDKSLLSFSYGYGKIQLVLHEKVKNQRQAGIVDLPGVKFMTGVMRGRFNPEDGDLYACGMSAWGTSQNMRGGEFYRLRYTGKPLSTPVALGAEEDGIVLSFASELDASETENNNSFEVQTWELLRSHEYGSKRYNTKTLPVSEVKIGHDGKSVKLILPDIVPVDIMKITYKVIDVKGNVFEGEVQNTIHNLRKLN